MKTENAIRIVASLLCPNIILFPNAHNAFKEWLTNNPLDSLHILEDDLKVIKYAKAIPAEGMAEAMMKEVFRFLGVAESDLPLSCIAEIEALIVRMN